MLQAAKKLLICGTGRAGTTLLVRILTVAGADTGFNDRQLREAAKNIGRAGLERGVSEKNRHNLPQVVKSPHLVNVLPRILAEKWFEIGLVIVPMRELEAAAQSRVSVHENALKNGMDPKRAPGGLWKTDEPTEQRQVLAEQFYRTLEPLVAYDVPHTLVSFPRFALEDQYFDEKIAKTLQEVMGFDRNSIMDAYRRECRPEMITGKDGMP